MALHVGMVDGATDLSLFRVDCGLLGVAWALDAYGRAFVWDWRESALIAQLDAFRNPGRPEKHKSSCLLPEGVVLLSDYSLLKAWSSHGSLIAEIELNARALRLIELDMAPVRLAVSLANGHILFFDGALKERGCYAGPTFPAWELAQSAEIRSTLLAGYKDGIHRISLPSLACAHVTPVTRLPMYLMSHGLDLVELASGEWGRIRVDGSYAPASTGALLGIANGVAWALDKLEGELVTTEYELRGDSLAPVRTHRLPEKPEWFVRSPHESLTGVLYGEHRLTFVLPGREADSWPACTFEKPINHCAVTQTGTALVISGGQPYRVDLE